MTTKSGLICTGMMICRGLYAGEDQSVHFREILSRLTPQGQPPPEGTLLGENDLCLALSFSRISDNLNFLPELYQVDPQGNKSFLGTISAYFPQDSSSYFTVCNFFLRWSGNGLYWYELFLDEELLARCPVHVNFSL